MSFPKQLKHFRFYVVHCGKFVCRAVLRISVSHPRDRLVYLAVVKNAIKLRFLI